MPYIGYATPDSYKNVDKGNLIPDSDLEKALRKASRHIDSLTFNRIAGKGFDALTGHQQEIIQEVVCQQAEFEVENADAIDSVLQSYGINGVSMQFGESWNVHVNSGVAIKKDTYSLLSQTGLTCRLAARL